MKKVALGELISHIMSIIIVVLVIVGIVLFIVNYVDAKNLLAMAQTNEEIDNIIKDKTANILLFVGLNYLICILLGAISSFLYALKYKPNNKIIICKIASALIPGCILAILIIIWMGLK